MSLSIGNTKALGKNLFRADVRTQDGSGYPLPFSKLRMSALYDFGEAVGDGLTLLEWCDFSLPFGEP